MHIIFCSDPLAPHAVDDAYADEAQAAMASSLEYQLISYERLVHEHDAAAAVRRVPAPPAPELAIYCGWMMRPPEYQALYDALLARRLTLINSPAPYRTCHYLPESYLPIGAHPQSGMPLTREHRLFFLDGALLADAPYWDAPIDETAELPIEHFGHLVAQVPSRFYTMDVAQHIDGSWVIVELGDGQVAGLPKRMDVAAFYAALIRAGRDTEAVS
jgi:hypothetical protein